MLSVNHAQSLVCHSIWTIMMNLAHGSEGGRPFSPERVFPQGVVTTSSSETMSLRMLQWQDMTRWQDSPGQARLLLHYLEMTIQSMSQVTCISRYACQATPTARLSIAVCAAASCCWYWWSPCQQLRRVENATGKSSKTYAAGRENKNWQDATIQVGEVIIVPFGGKTNGMQVGFSMYVYWENCLDTMAYNGHMIDDSGCVVQVTSVRCNSQHQI